MSKDVEDMKSMSWSKHLAALLGRFYSSALWLNGCGILPIRNIISNEFIIPFYFISNWSWDDPVILKLHSLNGLISDKGLLTRLV